MQFQEAELHDVITVYEALSLFASFTSARPMSMTSVGIVPATFGGLVTREESAGTF